MSGDFLLLNQRTGWEVLEPSGVVAEDTLRLQSLPGTSQPMAELPTDGGSLSDLTVDRVGNLYALDSANHRICWLDNCAEPGQFVPLRTIGGQGSAPRQLDDPRAITVSTNNDLLVVDTGNRRVQVFALKGLVLRAIWGAYRVEVIDGDRCIWPVTANADGSWPDGTWLPTDIAAVADHFYVVDNAIGLVHRFDRAGEWQSAHDGLDENGVGLAQPVLIAASKDHLFIAHAVSDHITVLDLQGNFVRRIPPPDYLEATFTPNAIGVDADGQLYVADFETGQLHVYDKGLHAAVACFLPRPSGSALVFDDEGYLLLVDKESGGVRRVEANTAYPVDGQVLIGPLDSQLYRCQWHRVLLAGEIVMGTVVEVETFSADSPMQKENIKALPDERWQTKQSYTQVDLEEWDCLVRSQPGRYLWLRLALRGDGDHTPIIRLIHIDYPRNSSLRFLPAVFREDQLSAEFMGRFLSIFDLVFGQFGDTITHIARYFDPLATPSDFLPWLASWLGIILEQYWPLEKQRELVAKAHRLFARRGTVEGLQMHLEIYAGMEPQILEHFKIRRWLYLNQGRLGSDTMLWGSAVVGRLQLDQFGEIGRFQLRDTEEPLTDPYQHQAHQFTVYVPLANADEIQRRTMERIIEEAKPAHTQANLVIVEPRMRVGDQSIVGVNTAIGMYPSAGVTLNDDEAALGDGTILSPSEDESNPPTLRIGKRSRVGRNTLLD